MSPRNEGAPRDTVRPFSPAVGAARPHGVPTPTSNITDDCEVIPYRLCNGFIKICYNVRAVTNAKGPAVEGRP